MKTFDTVEDYIEVIGGYRDVVAGKTKVSWMLSFEPIISLARYDVDVLTSMCETSSAGKALTERQGELACKIILKYQRQLANKGVDVEPVNRPVWRHPLRKMDYSRSLRIDNDKIILQFPYVTKLIDDLRAFRKDSQGKCEFNKDARYWAIGLTEYNLNYLHTWAQANDFTISPEVTALINMIAEVEAQPYTIELTCTSDGLDITNCPESLRTYINTNLGGFDISNLLRLADASSNLGFTINKDLAQAVMQEWGARSLRLASNREVKINANTGIADDDFASVLDYALQAKRTPVVIYEPDLSRKLYSRLYELYPAEQIIDASSGKGKLSNITEDTKFIYTIKPIRTLGTIPMLVSTAGMIFGGDKQIMMQRAEKVVYTSAEVYNKNQTGKKVIKIAG